MTLAGHLRELRKRVILAAAGIVVAAIAGWIFYPHLFALLQRPLLDVDQETADLVSITFTGVASAFSLRIEASLFIGVLLASPWWCYQLWAFINPGLTRKERRATIGFLACAVPLFFGGAYTAWTVIPAAVRILTSFAPEATQTLLGADVYFGFVFRMSLAFGLAFLLPIVMVAMTVMGAVAARTWLKGWRVAVVLVAVFAAIATPTGDIVTMASLAIPILALYFLAVGVSFGWERHRLRRIEKL
jgi:sec-independent protein translocase protein TatC